MSTISQDQKIKAEKFMRLINGVMELVDKVSSKIDEGEYLELCNNLRDLYKLNPRDNIGIYLRDELENNDVVRENVRRSNMTIRTKKTEILTDYEKLKTGGYIRCEDCSRVVSNSYYRQHKRNGVCIKTTASKKISADTGLKDTSQQEDLICKITHIKNLRRARTNTTN
tara:strand:- start:1328 stop:1834 length:507 start_codon:yes stop_codon:yes gene_type:complete